MFETRVQLRARFTRQSIADPCACKGLSISSFFTIVDVPWRDYSTATQRSRSRLAGVGRRSSLTPQDTGLLSKRDASKLELVELVHRHPLTSTSVASLVL